MTRSKGYQSILLIRLSSIGDVVLTSPIIRTLRQNFPKAHIAMLVGKRSAELVSENPRLDSIITYDQKAKGRNTTEMIRVIRELRQHNFDLAIDLQRKFHTAFLAYLSRAKCRVGYHQPAAFLCTVKVPDRVNKHAVEKYMELLEAIDIETSNADKSLELFISEADRDFAASTLEKFQISEESLKIGLFPGAGWKLREWMPERFAAIGELASKEFGAKVLVFGGKGEEALVNRVVNEIQLQKGNAFPFAGNLSLRQTAALIEKCDLFLTNDTGPMHIAVAMKTPTVALFGPGNHIKFQPVGDIHTLIRKPVPCSPCKQFTNKCKDNICMKSIMVEEVWKAVREKLSVTKV